MGTKPSLLEDMGINAPSGSNLSDHRILITGCTGFLGSWLTQACLNQGAEVIGLVRDRRPDSVFFSHHLDKQVTVLSGEVENESLLIRGVNEYEIDTIFHLAAQTIVTTAWKQPDKTLDTNIRGTWNLLEACRRSESVQSIIVASSDKAYGTQDSLPYSESNPLQGKSPYDVSKSCTDLITQMYHETYHLPVCITRFGNLFGGGDLNFSRLIPGTIKSIISGRNPEIRSDGSYLRDYVYIEDAVNAYLILAEAMKNSQIHGEAFNFGSGTPYSVLEIVNRIIKLTGQMDLEPVILNTAQAEIHHQYLSSQKSQQILGWKPQCGIDEGLIKTIEWYQNFFESMNEISTGKLI